MVQNEGNVEAMSRQSLKQNKENTSSTDSFQHRTTIMKEFLLFTSFTIMLRPVDQGFNKWHAPQFCLVLKLSPRKCKLFLYAKLSCNNITSIKFFHVRFSSISTPRDLEHWECLIGTLLNAELSRAKRASGAPWVRKFGYDVAYERRTSVHLVNVSWCQMSGYFGKKAYDHRRLVKQTQLKSYKDDDGKRKMFLYPCFFKC